MKTRTKILTGIFGSLFLLGAVLLFLLSSHLTTTQITIENATISSLSSVKINIGGDIIIDPEIKPYHIVTYKVKNQNEGSIKLSATLEGKKIYKNFGHITHNMHEDYFIYIRNSEDIRVY